MYDIRITKIGVVPMTRRSDIIKIFAIAALLGIAFYFSRITVYHGRNDRPAIALRPQTSISI